MRHFKICFSYLSVFIWINVPSRSRSLLNSSLSPSYQPLPLIPPFYDLSLLSTPPSYHPLSPSYQPLPLITPLTTSPSYQPAPPPINPSLLLPSGSLLSTPAPSYQALPPITPSPLYQPPAPSYQPPLSLNSPPCYQPPLFLISIPRALLSVTSLPPINPASSFQPHPTYQRLFPIKPFEQHDDMRDGSN